MSWTARIAEEKIREALLSGALDCPEMHGKPLCLEPSGNVPEELRLAYKLLKDAGFIPPEMELRKETLNLVQLLQTVQTGEDEARLLRDINEKILRLNLLMKRSCPHEYPQISRKRGNGLTPRPEGSKS